MPECDLDEMVHFIGQSCDDCRSHPLNRFKVRQYVRQAVLKFCPPDIASRVWGKLEVSVTKLLTWRNIRWKNFCDKVRCASTTRLSHVHVRVVLRPPVRPQCHPPRMQKHP